MNNVKQKLATAGDVANYLGVPVATLAQWRHVGRGPGFHKVGRHVRYVWADVDHWLDDQRSDGRGSAA